MHFFEDFKAEMPKYADECLDYGELWNKLPETHINADKAPRQKNTKKVVQTRPD